MQMVPLGVADGGLANQNNIVWVVWVCNVGASISLVASVMCKSCVHYFITNYANVSTFFVYGYFLFDPVNLVDNVCNKYIVLSN